MRILMYNVEKSKVDKVLAFFLEDNFLRQSMTVLLLSITQEELMPEKYWHSLWCDSIWWKNNLRIAVTALESGFKAIFGAAIMNLALGGDL